MKEVAERRKREEAAAELERARRQKAIEDAAAAKRKEAEAAAAAKKREEEAAAESARARRQKALADAAVFAAANLDFGELSGAEEEQDFKEHTTSQHGTSSVPASSNAKTDCQQTKSVSSTDIRSVLAKFLEEKRANGGFFQNEASMSKTITLNDEDVISVRDAYLRSDSTGLLATHLQRLLGVIYGSGAEFTGNQLKLVAEFRGRMLYHTSQGSYVLGGSTR